eukprot:PITA_04305
MEDKAFRKSREMPSEEQSKDESLVQPLRPAETSATNSPKDKASEEEESQEEEELIDVPTTSGRTSREIRQILRDAKDFIGAPKNNPTLYRQLIGSLMYLVNTRTDICYVVNTLSQFLVEPKRAHWAVAKHLIRYLQGTIEHGLLYTRGNYIRLSGFTDANWAGSSVDHKSTTGYCFNIGLGMTSWCSRKQKSVALSSVEAEYMASSTASCEAIWLRKLLVNLFRRRMEATRILCDNQSCIELSKNPIFHDRSKHIDIKCHFLKNYVQLGVVQLRYTPTGEQVADILTKALGRTKFIYFKEKMGMVKNPF